MSRNPHLFWAVFGIIRNEKNELLFLKRQNTWYYDDHYVFPAGHIEDGETSHEAIIHELAEEIWVKITEKDITVNAILHRLSNNSIQYFDVCYLIKNREWEIKNNEPEKCSGLYRFGEENIPENITPEMKFFLDHYFKYREEMWYYTYKE